MESMGVKGSGKNGSWNIDMDGLLQKCKLNRNKLNS